MKKSIFLFLFLILLSNFAFAVPPQQSIPEIEELTIIVPKEDVYKLGVMNELHFHIHNSSGALINSSDVTCNIHLYDHQGNHIYKNELIKDDEDVELEINTSLINTEGDYSYVVWCNATNGEYGYYSSVLSFTKFGYKTDLSYIIIVLSIFAVVVGLLIMGVSLDKTHFFLKVIIYIVSIYLMYLLPMISLNIQGIQSLSFFKVYIWFMRVFMAYMFLYCLYALLDYFGKLATIKKKAGRIFSKK